MFIYSVHGFSPRSTVDPVLCAVCVVTDRMSTTQRAQNNSGTVGFRLAVVMTGPVWICIEGVGIVLGHTPRAGPFLLDEFPGIGDVTVQILHGHLAVVPTLLAVRVFDMPSPLERMGVHRPVQWGWAYSTQCRVSVRPANRFTCSDSDCAWN